MEQKPIRRQIREKVLQTLYQIEINTEEAERIIQRMGEDLAAPLESIPEEAQQYFTRLARGTRDQQERIDSVIRRYLKGWSFSRLAIVDRVILRLALYELLFTPEVPEKVVVNEAIDLAKTFSTEKSGKFVNGILGAVINDLDELRSGDTP